MARSKEFFHRFNKVGISARGAWNRLDGGIQPRPSNTADQNWFAPRGLSAGGFDGGPGLMRSSKDLLGRSGWNMATGYRTTTIAAARLIRQYHQKIKLSIGGWPGGMSGAVGKDLRDSVQEAIAKKLEAVRAIDSSGPERLRMRDPYSSPLEEPSPAEAPTARSETKARSHAATGGTTPARRRGNASTGSGAPANPNGNKRRATSYVDAALAPAYADNPGAPPRERLGGRGAMRSGASSVLQSEGYGKGIAKTGMFSHGSSKARSFFNVTKNPVSFLNRSLVVYAAMQVAQEINADIAARGVGPLDTPEVALGKMTSSTRTFLTDNMVTRSAMRGVNNFYGAMAKASGALSGFWGFQAQLSGAKGAAGALYANSASLAGFGDWMATKQGGYGFGAYDRYLKQVAGADAKEMAIEVERAQAASFERSKKEVDDLAARNSLHLLRRGVNNLSKFKDAVMATKEYAKYEAEQAYKDRTEAKREYDARQIMKAEG